MNGLYRSRGLLERFCDRFTQICNGCYAVTLFGLVILLTWLAVKYTS